MLKSITTLAFVLIFLLHPQFVMAHGDEDDHAVENPLPDDAGCPEWLDVDLSRYDEDHRYVNVDEVVSIIPKVYATVGTEIYDVPLAEESNPKLEWSCDQCVAQIDPANFDVTLTYDGDSASGVFSYLEHLDFSRGQQTQASTFNVRIKSNPNFILPIPSQSKIQNATIDPAVYIKLKVTFACDDRNVIGYSSYKLLFAEHEESETEDDAEEGEHEHDEDDHEHSEGEEDDHEHPADDIVIESNETSCNDLIDNDADGFFDCEDAECFSVCHDMDSDGVTAAEGDCDESNAFVHPEAIELCDGIDNDCDGLIDLTSCSSTSVLPDSDITDDVDLPAGSNAADTGLWVGCSLNSHHPIESGHFNLILFSVLSILVCRIRIKLKSSL